MVVCWEDCGCAWLAEATSTIKLSLTLQRATRPFPENLCCGLPSLRQVQRTHAATPCGCGVVCASVIGQADAVQLL